MSVAKMADGKRWYSSVRYKDWTGKARQKKKEGFSTKKEAQAWERDFTAQQSGAAGMTVAKLYELYIADAEARLRPGVLVNKKNIFESHILPYFGDRQADQITPADIRSWQTHIMQSHDYSQTYLKSLNRQLSAMLNFAVRYKGLPSNPCTIAASMGKSTPSTEMQIWTQAELGAFLRALGDSEASVAFSILFWAGLREGELLALTPSDIGDGVIRVSKSYSRLHGEDLLQRPKTDRSRREVRVPSSLTTMIQAHIAKLYGIQQDDRIFPHTAHWLRKTMAATAPRAGVKPIRIHDLRHSYAALMISMLCPITTLSRQLGHEKVSTTLDLYGHMYPSDIDEMVEKLGKRFDSVTQEKA